MILRFSAIAAALIVVVGTNPGVAGAVTFVPAKQVRVSYYLPTGRATFSGIPPFVGAAACSWDIPLGTVAVFKDGRPVICLDRGNLGSEGWIDLYAPDREFGRDIERAYGQRTTVRLFLP
ncbi:MAG: hypothetical protein RMM58_07180 [Chloroflexota bacterium]|nr:hypothetical protein [Dehalococcoidia bacterium]MDW8253641.1 hypothetical protein [Chloroflexota bacterium]